MLEFNTNIGSNDKGDFSNHSQLLEHLLNRVLPICNSSRGYRFEIFFVSEENSATTVIVSSILHMSEIKRCSILEIHINYGEQNQLPVMAISNWLERPEDDDKENNIQN